MGRFCPVLLFKQKGWVWAGLCDGPKRGTGLGVFVGRLGCLDLDIGFGLLKGIRLVY